MSDVAQRDEVHVPRVLGRDHAPGAELAAELERGAADRSGEPAGVRARVARDGEVDVVGVAAEQPVAHGAADQPRRLAGEGGASRLERLTHTGAARAS